MKSIAKQIYPWLLVLAAIIFAGFRFPSLIEPNWYGDEGIYQVVAKAINDGRILYQQIWDNKPPLLYLIYAIANGDLYFAKLLSLLAGLISVVAFYFLSLNLFKKKTSRYVSLFLFSILFGLPILEGNIANAENFMMLPTITAAIFVLKYQQTKKVKLIIIAGLLMSISLALKIVAIFDLLAFLTFLIIVAGKEVRRYIQSYLFFGLSSILLLLISAVYFLANGAFNEFLQAVFLQNFNYVGEESTFIFPMGILIIKTFVLLFLILLIKYFSNKITKESLFIYLWTSFGLYSAFFSDRPYIHYLLLVLPAFCLLSGNLFEKAKGRLFEIIAILTILYFAIFHFQVYGKNIEYYKNFFNFVTDRKNVVQYEAFFDSNTPRDYIIAEFISMNTQKDEDVFLWSDSAQIYALSNKLPIGKYIVAYHIKFYDNADTDTKNRIETIKPKYIIQTAQDSLIDETLSSYQLRYIINGAKIYERQI